MATGCEPGAGCSVPVCQATVPFLSSYGNQKRMPVTQEKPLKNSAANTQFDSAAGLALRGHLESSVLPPAVGSTLYACPSGLCLVTGRLISPELRGLALCVSLAVTVDVSQQNGCRLCGKLRGQASLGPLPKVRDVCEPGTQAGRLLCASVSLPVKWVPHVPVKTPAHCGTMALGARVPVITRLPLSLNIS